MATVVADGDTATPLSTTPAEQTQPDDKNATKKAASTPKTKAKKSSRAGVPNYSDDDINELLDLAEQVEPLGANHWSIVATRFGEWAEANDRPKRDFESLRSKFDKLANAKKKTGDPSCPPSVRRAKHIARAIQNKCAAMTLGDSSEGEVEETEGGGSTEEGTNDTDKEGDVVGARKKKRKTAATGQPVQSKQKTEELLLAHVGKMAGHIGKLSDSIAGTFGIPSTQKEELASMIREEVSDILRPTDLLLLKMNKILETLEFPKET